ncbi:MAG: sigma-70 family RNA polymerase sigma factor [Anaeromyxobacter sp.]
MESDDQLVEAARGGDRQALERLLVRHQARVFRFGMKMCRAEEDAKDVLQETLLAAARSLPEFRGASSISTWLFTIARSFCIKHRRRSRFAPEVVESLDQGEPARAALELADPARGPDEHLEGRRLETALDDAIGSLEPMYREVLVLRDVEGLTAPEVAEILGLTVEAVKSRLHRARVAVRERMAPVLEAGLPELVPARAGPVDTVRGEPVEPRTDAGCRDVVEAFSRRLEGEIAPSLCAELEEHLKGCQACQRRCDSLRSTLKLCRTAGEAPVPATVARTVRKALQQLLR